MQYEKIKKLNGLNNFLHTYLNYLNLTARYLKLKCIHFYKYLNTTN